MSEAYRQSGVNLELGDELSKMLYEASKQTWANREGVFGEPAESLDSFSGLRSLSIAPLLGVKDPEGLEFSMGDDGVGTKVEVAQRNRNLSTVAFDLFAMVCDDAVIRGFEPVAITTTLDVERLDESMREQMTDLAAGYIAAAGVARVAVVNGEVAELGNLVGGYRPPADPAKVDDTLRFNWSATLLSVGHRTRLLDGSRVQPGDDLVALREEGLRSNGLSLVRKTFEKLYPNGDWHTAEGENGRTLGELAAHPSTIYTPLIVDAFGGYDLEREARADIHGAAHITGGGIPGKLGRMLEATGLGAEIEDPFEPGHIIKRSQKAAEISDHEAYKVWNMGQGMLVATSQAEELLLLAWLHGIEAKVAGTVVNQPGIRIRSAGRASGKKLEY